MNWHRIGAICFFFAVIVCDCAVMIFLYQITSAIFGQPFDQGWFFFSFVLFCVGLFIAIGWIIAGSQTLDDLLSS